MTFVPVYIFILFFTIIVDYFAGIYIEKSVGKRRKIFLILSLVANIGVLAAFKYYNFFNENLTHIFGHLGISNHLPYLTILLPIGLSFHTFQAMSYTMEVYKGNYQAERNFGIYSLYVMFYPQLVAGPIERPQNMLHQFREKHTFNYQRVADGLKLMAWGLFKKGVIADRLSVIVNMPYDNPHSYQGISFVIATVCFAFQIFCDFSGYTDMALGAAKVMGFTLMKNFNRPYRSRSISEFWSRWHISLSTWFRDYLYIPLGGNRVSIPRWYFNLFIVFLVSGLWHGANWTYLAWGGLNGFYLIFALVTKDLRDKLTTLTGIKKYPRIFNGIQTLVTFALICISWVFFRAHTIADAVYILKSIFNRDTLRSTYAIIRNPDLLFVSVPVLATAALVILILEVVHYFEGDDGIVNYINQKPKYIRWSIYYAFVVLMLMLAQPTHQQFIYFQF